MLQMSRLKNLTNRFFYERITIYSLLFLLIALSLDCFYQFLPVTGYRLLLTNLIIIGCTTYATCHGIKWAITSNQLLQMYVLEKSEIKMLMNFLKKYETIFCKILEKIFCFENFRYSTSVNEQTRLLLKDLERDFIKIWYSDISQNPSFLYDTHLILEEICHKIIAKLKTLNLRNLIINTLIIYLDHLQQYKKLKKKLFSLNFKVLSDTNMPKVEILDLYQFLHPATNNNHMLNYYFKKITKSALKEFAPLEFSNSLECKILSGIIGRKLLKKLLITLEDPNWINLKFIYLLNPKKHEEILQGKVYMIKKKSFDLNEDNELFKNFLLISKRFFPLNIFEVSKNLCESSDLIKGKSAKEFDYKEKVTFKQDLATSTVEAGSEYKKSSNFNRSNDLSPSVAESLKVENAFTECQSINQTHTVLPMDKENGIFPTVAVPLNNFSFKKMKGNKMPTRSKSTETLNIFSEIEREKDVIKEKYCKNVFYSDFIIGTKSNSFKKLTKTKSFDGEDVLIETLTKREVISVNESPIFEHNRDVSPVYEESEDFATTIAKLRSLLQQRESSTLVLNEKDLSEDPEHLTTTFKKSINKCHALEKSSLSSSLQCEFPNNLFLNVSIPKAELITDHVSVPYVLYSIQYNGRYILKHQQTPEFNKPKVVVRTTVIKRRFQDFLNLQTKLEENVSFKNIMKGVKGPKNCLDFSFCETDQHSSSSGDRSTLENFLCQLCSNASISNSSELQEFLGYNSNGTVSLTKKDCDSSLQRLDKLLGNTFTGVFNSLKTVFPSLDFDTPAFATTIDNTRNFQGQKGLQGFPSFGSKQELLDQEFDFIIAESSGDSLVDDIRQHLRGKNENVEDAVDALNSTDWLSEQKECKFLSSEKKCMWHNFKDLILDDELELLDSKMPIYSLLLDIICELLQDTDSWIIKEPSVRLIKVVFGHIEYQLEKELSTKDWNWIIGNVIRTLRLTFFQR